MSNKKFTPGELRECPFCGTKAVSSIFSIDVYNWYEENVLCEECRCSIAHPQAITIWNTRPAEDALQAEIERLKSALQQIVEISNRRGTLSVATWRQAKIAKQALAGAPETNAGSAEENR